MKTLNKTRLFLILLPGLLTACGFHLRGEQDLSAVLPEVKVQGVDKYSDLGRDLTRALLAAKVNVTDDSNVILEISNEGLSKRVLSVDSAGRANQYELNYQLSYKLVKLTRENIKTENETTENKTTGNEITRLQDLLPQQTIAAKREYLFDANSVLAKADEENQLKKDMRQAVMLQLVRRLMFSLKAEKTETVQPETK